MLYQLSYTHHRHLIEVVGNILTCAPPAPAIGYRSGLTSAFATALAWSLVGPGCATNAVPR